MKKQLLALLMTVAPALASGETFTQPVMINDGLAEALWTLMGPEFKSIPEGARVKQSHTTCLRVVERLTPRYICQTLGSDYRLVGPAAETLFRALPARRQSHDGRGGVYRGTRVTCTETGDAAPYTYLCAVPQ